MPRRVRLPGDRSPAELRKELDRLFFDTIRARDGNKCRKCGAEPREVEKVSSRGKQYRQRLALNPHHIFSRSYAGTRWEPDNGILLCVSCHLRWASSRFEEFRDWILVQIGEPKFQKIKWQAYNGKRPDLWAAREYLLAHIRRWAA